MKYLKSFNENINNSEIDAICEKYNIKHYTINEDGTIDVIGDVVLSRKNLDKLPLKFGKVTGDFYCDENKLINLDGAPQSVGGWFWCSNNDLITLEGGPKYVGSDFYCEYNKITSLKGIPKKIKNNLSCSNNKIKNIDHLPIYKILYIKENPIYKILSLFIKLNTTQPYYAIKTKENKELLYEFKEREIIQNDILLLDRLVEFLEDVNKPQTKEYLYQLLENEYEIR